MSEQEWTPDDDYVYEGAGWPKGGCVGRAYDKLDAKRICDAHNAALAAERQKTSDACKATFGVNQAWQDRFDLLRDEFLRIAACPNVTDEIKGICERAEKDIRRLVPLIDELAAERKEHEWVKAVNKALLESQEKAVLARNEAQAELAAARMESWPRYNQP